jgi:hypothetical protein
MRSGAPTTRRSGSCAASASKLRVSKGESLTTNQKVVVWARGKLGHKIGRGECWDLGEAALKQAGASTSSDLGPLGADTD